MWLEGHTAAHRGLHGGLGCEAGFGCVQLQFSELALVVQFYSLLDRADGVAECAVALLTGLGNDAGGLNADKSLLSECGNVLLDSVCAHTNGLSNGFITGMALIGFAILTAE